ncbi:MAG: LolA family protein [Flavobacteriaceae bacterium]
MKKLLFYFFLLINNSIYCQSSEDAKKILDDVSKKISSFENISFDFTYSLNNKEEQIKQETNGNVTVSGNKYKLNYLGSTQIFDGEKTYTIIPENEEITISQSDDENEVSINPSKLLTFYKSGYSYSMDIKQKHLDKSIQFIKLTPIEKNSDLKYLLLGIDIDSKDIFRLIEIGKNQTTTTLTINNQKTNMLLNNSFFSINLKNYPNYFINN